MVNINISIKEDAYEYLKSLKGRDKSFSDVILEFKSEDIKKKGSKETLMDFFGAMKDLGVDWGKKEKMMKSFRKDFERRLNDRIGHNSNN